MIKRIINLIAAVIAVSLLIPLTSCAKQAASDKPVVIGTVFPQFDFARQIGGDDIECEMLLRPGADSHSYTGDDPSDIYSIMNSDIFIYVGGETDSAWVDSIKNKIKSEGKSSPLFISLCDICDTVEENDLGIIEQEDASDEELPEPEYDEHVWTSPKNAIKISRAICEALCKIDQSHSENYIKRCDEYINDLIALDEKLSEITRGSTNKTLVFADRFPFRYMANEYGLKCYAAFNGCASQSEPSPTTIVKLCEIIESNDIHSVIYIETSHSGVPDLISGATGCEKLLLHSCHTVTQRELDEGETYLSIMNRNANTLRKALNDGN